MVGRRSKQRLVRRLWVWGVVAAVALVLFLVPDPLDFVFGVGEFLEGALFVASLVVEAVYLRQLWLRGRG